MAPLLNSFFTNYKLLIRKLHNSVILKSSDKVKCNYEHIQSDHCSGTMEDGRERPLGFNHEYFIKFSFYSYKENS